MNHGTLSCVAYLRPPWFTVRVFNKTAMRTGIADHPVFQLAKVPAEQPDR